MRVLFFAVNRSPFTVELIDTLYEYLPKGSYLKMILQHSLEKERSHWGEKVCKNPVDIVKAPNDLLQFLNDEKPDVIIYTSYRSPKFMEAKKWALDNHVKFFVNASEKLIEYRKSPLFVLLKYQLFRYRTKGVNGVLAISNRAMDLYQKYCDAPTMVVPYTFDMTRLLNFTPLPYDGMNLTFLISGRLEPFRDPIYSIKMFAELKSLRPNINMNLIISGKGSLYEEIKQLLKYLKIEECTTWMNDFKQWTEIHEIYKKAHILLCFQEYGGWGLIVPEAMAAGMLVACSMGVDSGDNCIIDGYNGLYCNRKDRKTTISAMLEIIDNPEEMKIIRQRARETAKYGDVRYYSKRLSQFIQDN